MKKIKFKLLAFSLAEALITLLIVCLITLASIPVLTKKKRDVNTSGPRGMWICTRNSNGQYVYWDMNDPVGSKDDPDTWRVTDKCAFTPPQGAARFSLTVVGGGGGGGDAKSTNISMARARGTASSAGTASFSPTVDGHYFVEVVGGGGGGGDVVCNSDLNDPAGGSGGSGAAVYGSLYLLKGATYTLVAGKSGEYGSSHYHGGCNNSSNSRDPGGHGGDSSFKTNGTVDSTTNIDVGGGGGGDSTSYNGDHHAIGGTAGVAGVVKTANTTSRSESVVRLTGYSGENGDSRNFKLRYLRPQGGQSVAKTASYGRGSDGGRCIPSTDELDYAQPGYVEVSLIDRYFGRGGEAAVPVSYFLPSIKGKIEATIPDRADSGKTGGTVYAYMIYNGVTGRTFSGFGGRGGSNSNTISEPEAGSHSQVTMTGGGIPSPECTKSEYIPEGYGPIDMSVLECSSVKCMIDVSEDKYSVTKNQNILDKNVTPVGTRIVPAGFGTINYGGQTVTAPVHVVDTNSPIYIDTLQSPISWKNAEAYLRSALKMYYYYENMGYSTNPHLSYFKNYFFYMNDGDKYSIDPEQGEFSVYDNASSIYRQYCFKDSNITYKKVCTEENTITRTITGYHSATYTPAYCSNEQQGGNGTMFGAGGGGGYATDTPNVASKGGKGGYGAVIIEW